jgi:hypothetical protein
VSAGASREPSVAEPAIIRGVDCLYERRGTSRCRRLGSGRAGQDRRFREIGRRRTLDSYAGAVHGPAEQVFSVTDVGVVLTTGPSASGFPRLCEWAKRVRMHVALNEAAKQRRIQRASLRSGGRGNRAPSRSWSFRHYDHVPSPHSLSAEGSFGTRHQHPICLCHGEA